MQSRFQKNIIITSRLKQLEFLKIVLSVMILFCCISVSSQTKKAQIINLQQEIIDLIRQKDDLRNTIDDLNNKNKGYSKEIEIKNARISFLEDQIQRLKELNDLQNRNSNIAIDSLQKENESLLSSINFLRKENLMHSKLFEVKTILTGEDSITLRPFEFFTIALFEGVIQQGMNEAIEFKVKSRDKDSMYLVFPFVNILPSTPKGTEKQNDRGFYTEHPYIDILLGKELKRRIHKGDIFKIIYSFKRDEFMAREKYYATEVNEGFEIIDIVPLGKKFERQIPAY